VRVAVGGHTGLDCRVRHCVLYRIMLFYVFVFVSSCLLLKSRIVRGVRLNSFPTRVTLRACLCVGLMGTSASSVQELARVGNVTKEEMITCKQDVVRVDRAWGYMV